MARRLTKRPSWAGTVQGGRRGIYPWDEWISIPKGETVGMVVLTKGTDYTIGTEMIRQSAIQAAVRLGFKITTTVKPDGDKILITTIEKRD
ncbi:MAG: hypothetical protein MKZ66_05930 [Acidimicrobiales bacterium]|nr:hypothetical protein [Acidimicrobiales bacterium]